MKAITKERETYDIMIQRLMNMQEETIKAMQVEIEPINTAISNIFTKISHYLKHNEIKETQTGSKELQSYENILQDLLALKEATMEAKMNEAESIETVLHKLSIFCDYNVSPLPSTTYDMDIDAILNTVHDRVAININ